MDVNSFEEHYPILFVLCMSIIHLTDINGIIRRPHAKYSRNITTSAWKTEGLPIPFDWKLKWRKELIIISDDKPTAIVISHLITTSSIGTTRRTKLQFTTEATNIIPIGYDTIYSIYVLTKTLSLMMILWFLIKAAATFLTFFAMIHTLDNNSQECVISVFVANFHDLEREEKNSMNNELRSTGGGTAFKLKIENMLQDSEL